jgi:hypothetical protein
MRGAISPLPQYAFLAWCLVKYKEKFTFTLPVATLTELYTPHCRASDSSSLYRVMKAGRLGNGANKCVHLNGDIIIVTAFCMKSKSCEKL